MKPVRLAAASGAAVLAIAAAGFLVFNARTIDPASHSRVIANLSKLQELDANLDEIVLKLRDALLNNYDPLVDTLNLIRAHRRDLERKELALARLGGADVRAAMVTVDARLAEKEALIEQFKSRNAVLKNSYHYFPRSIETLMADSQVPRRLRASFQFLLRDILLLRLGATPTDYDSIARQINDLQRQQEAQPPAVRAKTGIALQHARNVLEHQAHLDRLVQDATSTAVSRTSQSLTEAYNRAFEGKLREANVYRFILLLTSIALLTYAAWSFLRLRDNASALRRALSDQSQEMARREAAQFALRQSEDRYRKMFEQHPHPMWLYDPQTFAFLAVNEAAIRHYGYTRDEFLCMTIKDIRPAEDIARLTQSVGGLTSGKRSRLPSRHVKKDGTLIQVEITSSEFSLVDRAARLVLVDDVTEKLKAEEDLRLAARALENAAEGVMISDRRRRIVAVNKSFSRITGYASEEVIGRESDFLRSSEHGAAFYEQLWSEVRQSGSWQGEQSRRRKDGALYPEWRSISAVKDAAGEITHFVSVFSDISQAKQAKARLEFLVHHDVLTGLPNRVLFLDRLQEAVNRAHRHGAMAGLLFVDLDRFKDVNDSLGHGMGDRLLQEAAVRLKACIRETDTVARLGGDEFTMLTEELAESQQATVIADKVLATLSRPFTLGDHEVFVSASIGISCYPQDGADPETLLKNADAAMYQAKEHGRGTFRFFSAEMNAHALEKLVLVGNLRGALERDEFLLEYQPIFSLGSGRLNAVEALVRWNRPGEGLVPPSRFIPVAEDSGLIIPIGEWVLRTACATMKAWCDAGHAPRRMAVNLSARQFRQKNLAQRVEAILRDTGLAAHRLELEITESMVMEDPDEAKQILRQLHESGIGLAIDDFGTGHSSLSYLKRFPIDFLKIDRSFVRDIPGSADDVAIVRAIIALAKSMNLQVIAEGVETESQRAFLDMEGCEEAQGYLLGRPVDAGEIERQLREPYAH